MVLLTKFSLEKDVTIVNKTPAKKSFFFFLIITIFKGDLKVKDLNKFR